MFASIAKKEGLVLINSIFEETANQEKEHASWFYKMLQELKKQEKFEMLEVKTGGPTTYGSTKDNLKSAIEGENYEWQTMYPGFADIAEKEGFKNISARIKSIARAEKHHAERYGKLLKVAGEDLFFKRGKKVVWICMNCGYEVEMDSIPENYKCPSCDHERSYFRIKCEEF
jgi:rubrerythrin